MLVAVFLMLSIHQAEFKFKPEKELGKDDLERTVRAIDGRVKAYGYVGVEIKVVDEGGAKFVLVVTPDEASKAMCKTIANLATAQGTLTWRLGREATRAEEEQFTRPKAPKGWEWLDTGRTDRATLLTREGFVLASGDITFEQTDEDAVVAWRIPKGTASKLVKLPAEQKKEDLLLMQNGVCVTYFKVEDLLQYISEGGPITTRFPSSDDRKYFLLYAKYPLPCRLVEVK